MPALNVGFWNIEKANRPGADPRLMDWEDERSLARLDVASVQALRWQVATETVKEWFRRVRFDVLIMAEVTRANTEGDVFVDSLCQTLNTLPRMAGADYDIKGRFIPSRGSSGAISSCNFAVFWDSNVRHLRRLGVGKNIDDFWTPTQVRPAIVLKVANEFVIGGIHAKSGRFDLARQEITDTCHELYQYGLPAMLIGDMNVDFESLVKDRDRTYEELKRFDWDAVAPGFYPTFVSENEAVIPAVLDYAWHRLCNCEPRRPVRYYEDWTYIDHSPVQYRVVW